MSIPDYISHSPEQNKNRANKFAFKHKSNSVPSQGDQKENEYQAAEVPYQDMTLKSSEEIKLKTPKGFGPDKNRFTKQQPNDKE